MVGLHTSGTFLNLTFAINAELRHWARHAQLIRLTLMKNVFGMRPFPSVTLQRNFLSFFYSAVFALMIKLVLLLGIDDQMELLLSFNSFFAIYFNCVTLFETCVIGLGNESVL